LIAKKWNDPEFNPLTRVSSCHELFSESIDCSYVNVANMSRATPEKVEDLFTTMRANLLRIISLWEQSGQGDGGLDMVLENDVRFGNLTDRPRRALDSRKSFLNGKGPYHLYFWEVADEHQLLGSALQRIADTASAPDANSIGNVSGSNSVAGTSVRKSIEESNPRRRGRDHDVDDGAESFRMLACAISSFSNEAKLDRAQVERAHIRQRIETLEDKQREYRRLFHERGDTFFQQESERIQEDIASLKEELTQKNVLSTPT
jgi:hypothetical protein